MNNVSVKICIDKYPECNLCLSRENVFEIRKKDSNYGYVFQICKTCLKDIHSQLINLEKDEKNN